MRLPPSALQPSCRVQSPRQRGICVVWEPRPVGPSDSPGLFPGGSRLRRRVLRMARVRAAPSTFEDLGRGRLPSDFYAGPPRGIRTLLENENHSPTARPAHPAQKHGCAGRGVAATSQAGPRAGRVPRGVTPASAKPSPAARPWPTCEQALLRLPSKCKPGDSRCSTATRERTRACAHPPVRPTTRCGAGGRLAPSSRARRMTALLPSRPSAPPLAIAHTRRMGRAR